MFRSKNLLKSKTFLNTSTIEKSSFLTLSTGMFFTKLRQTVIHLRIYLHFDSKYYIQIKTNISSYTI